MTTNSSQKASFHHSSIEYDNGVVRKLIEPQFSFPPGAQESLLGDITLFRTRLKDVGVPVADRYTLQLHEGVIVEETLNCGVDGYSLLGWGTSATEVLSKIIKALLPLLLEDEVRVVPDPHPANWCFDARGDVRYIDFQPPRFLKADGTRLVGFPQPTGREYDWSVERYYSKFALLRILRFNAMRAAGSQVTAILEQVIREECPGPLSKEFNQGTSSILEQRVRNGSLTLEDALGECDEWRVDDIRELAMFASDRSGVNNTGFLERVLELTRVDFNLTIEARRSAVEAAKSLILAH